MFHDLTDNYKSRDYVIAITLKEGHYSGDIFYQYGFTGYGLLIEIMEEILFFIKGLNCNRINELNEEGLLNNSIGLRADINGRDLHFELRNGEKEVLAKTIPEGDLQKYIVGYQMIKCDGHGKKKERRKCNSCQNFELVKGSAKGTCTARGDIIQRSRIICAFNYISKEMMKDYRAGRSEDIS